MVAPTGSSDGFALCKMNPGPNDFMIIVPYVLEFETGHYVLIYLTQMPKIGVRVNQFISSLTYKLIDFYKRGQV